jgi:hypothetical protein
MLVWDLNQWNINRNALMKIIEQDSGLWQVWANNGCCVGFIFDGGWKVSGNPRRKKSLYHSLARWDNGDWKQQGLLGSNRNFMRAVAILFSIHKRKMRLHGSTE